MKAIVLAAGKGERLYPLTADRPKALVPLRGKPLISYILSFLSRPPIDEIIVVGGYRASLLKDLLSPSEQPIRFVENRDYDNGNLKSLEVALPFVDDDFILANADHIYPKALLTPLLEEGKKITIACDFNRRLGDDDMKIRRGLGGSLSIIGKGLKSYEGGYIGLTLCDRPSLADYQRAVEKTARLKGDGAVVEDVLNTLVAEGWSPRIFDASPYVWVEVDTPQELLQAEAFLKER